MLKKFFCAAVFAASLFSLSGCGALILGGAAVGGLAYADRRTGGAQADDQLMEINIGGQIKQYLQQRGHKDPTVSVTSYNRVVLLTGMVADEEEKNSATRIARSQTAAREVHNYMTIADGRNAADIANDAWITSKVRTVLLNAKGYSPNHVKVVTYNGITYAMGILTPEEQAAATAQISTTAGVIKVITLYETFLPTAQ